MATSLPASSPAALPASGATVHLPAAKSGTARGVFLSLWLLGGVNGTAQPGLLKSLSKEGAGEKPKGQPERPASVGRSGLGN